MGVAASLAVPVEAPGVWARTTAPGDPGVGVGSTQTGLLVATAATPSPNVVEGLTVPAPGAATVTAGPVLDVPDGAAPTPDPDVLQDLLDPIAGRRALGGDAAYLVLDGVTGDPLAARRADSARVPASTAKLLTAAAALSALGPQTTLPTRVLDGATDDEVVLVGGGDALLGAGVDDPDEVVGHAGLVTLARRVARRLRADGRTTVAVRLDDSIFTGPSVSPRWDSTDVSDGFVAPIAPVAIRAGSLGKGLYPQRALDPAMSAAETFAEILGRQRGITVAGDVARTKARSGSAELGRVESAPVGDIVEHVLQDSDNTVAEVLARLVARASRRPATFSDAGVAVVDQVALLGVDVRGAKLTGGSGLSSGSAVSPETLAQLLRVAASAEHPELRPLLSGLPIAAATGTLATRFDEKGDRVAGGVLRAKTGTLTGVHSLAGTVVDADGRVLVFAVLAGGKGTDAARDSLDDFGARLAACGCR